MNILQISFHTSPFGSVGKFDSGGLNVYVHQISKQLSNENNVTVVTAEKAENFKTDNLDFYSLDLFEPGLSVDDKEIQKIIQETTQKDYQRISKQSRKPVVVIQYFPMALKDGARQRFENYLDQNGCKRF